MSSNKNVETVKHLLTNATDQEVLKQLCASEVTDVSPLLQKCKSQAAHAIRRPPRQRRTWRDPIHLHHLRQIWNNEDFQIEAIFGEGDHVAVFGHFTYRSHPLGKAYQSPFNVWCKFNEQGKVYYMQFMEDTFGTGATFEDDGTGIKKKYKVLDKEFEL